MITKGVITKVIENSNKYEVSLPSYKNAGSQEDFLVEAMLCYQPGNFNGYAVGDYVFVGFENNSFSHAVILGKFYTQATAQEEKNNAVNYSCDNSLTVTTKATLPSDTTIGKMTADEIYDAIQNISQILSRLQNVEYVADNGGGGISGEVVAATDEEIKELFDDTSGYYWVETDDSKIVDMFDDSEYDQWVATNDSKIIAMFDK